MSNSERDRIARKHNAMSSDGSRYAPKNDNAIIPKSSKYGYKTTNSTVDPLSQAFRYTKHSKKRVTLPKISKGRSNDQD